ncbi:MAG: hypothetical protein R8M11_09650 [Gallionella sp.]
MKFSNTDFHLLRWNIIALSISIAVSGIFIYASEKFSENSAENSRIALKLINDARSRLNTALQDKDNFATYTSEYSDLEDRKILGDDHRLDWMEGLNKLGQQNLVMDFSYTISPQTIYTPQPVIDSGNFEIHYSEMKLQLELLHEGQLLNFFNAMNGQIAGYYQLDSCTLSRVDMLTPTEEESPTPEAKTNIMADCNGGWITLQNRNTLP